MLLRLTRILQQVEKSSSYSYVSISQLPPPLYGGGTFLLLLYMELQVSREEGEEEALHRLSPQFVSLEEVEEGEAGQGRLERENMRLKEQVVPISI